MHKLDSDGPGSYRVSHKRDFVRNGILRQEDVSECFDFSYGMTFGGSGAHRDHRSGGQAHRHMGEIFINTFQGKLAEFALYNYAVIVGEMSIDPPDTEMMELTRWDSFDMDIEGSIINVKSTKKRGNLLLLETRDWDSEGRYIPNSESGCEAYDFFVLARVDPDGEKIMREHGLLYADSADKEILRKIILSERWRVNLAGYITGEELTYTMYRYSSHPLNLRMKMSKGLTARFDYRYLLLKDFMKPKSASPFLLDAHSSCNGSPVFSASGVNLSGWFRT